MYCACNVCASIYTGTKPEISDLLCAVPVIATSVSQLPEYSSLHYHCICMHYKLTFGRIGLSCKLSSKAPTLLSVFLLPLGSVAIILHSYIIASIASHCACFDLYSALRFSYDSLRDLAYVLAMLVFSLSQLVCVLLQLCVCVCCKSASLHVSTVKAGGTVVGRCKF